MKSIHAIRSFVVFGLLSVAFVGGCVSAVPNNQDDSVKKQEVTKATSADVWDAVAQAVEQGTIKTPRMLAQYVKSLNANGDLNDSDLSSFNGSFEDAPNDSRQLDSAKDARTLRSLK